MPLFEGIVGGLTAGMHMGLISHAGFKAGIFRSSLFIIDGTFVQNILRLKGTQHKALLLGIPVHLFTSISFGLGYVIPGSVLKLDLLNGWLIAVGVGEKEPIPLGPKASHLEPAFSIGSRLLMS